MSNAKSSTIPPVESGNETASRRTNPSGMLGTLVQTGNVEAYRRGIELETRKAYRDYVKSSGLSKSLVQRLTTKK